LGEVGDVPDASSQGIFLSYRREDATPYARLLKSELTGRFPDVRVFMDLDAIEPGLDFAEVIEEAVGSCAVLVALIGRQWATLADAEGRRRLDDPDDLVRYEVQTALERGVRVIPVLVDDARPLRRQELPAELHKLARLNALELSSGRYQYDADRLLDLVQKVLAAANELSETARQIRGEAGRQAPQRAKQKTRGIPGGPQALPGDQPSGAEEPATLGRRRQAEKRVLYIQARAELRVENFDDAISLLDDLLILDPDYPEAAALRNTAQRGRHLANTYASAIAAQDAGDWTAAVRGYGEILQSDPAYRDAATRKLVCEARQQVADLQAELRHHADASQWQAVLDVDAELSRLDESSSDPDGLTTRARASLEAEKARKKEAEKARKEAEQKAREEAERQDRVKRAKRRGSALAARKAQKAQKALEEAEQKALEEAEQKAREEAERQERVKRAERRGSALAARKAREG
jgi:hypothetical protein